MSSNALAKRLGLSSPGTSWLSARSLRRPSNKLLTQQLPDVIDLLCQCLSGGMGYRESFEYVAARSSSSVKLQLQQILDLLASGDSVAIAMLKFEGSAQHPALRELALKLALAEQLGSPVIPALKSLADSTRAAALLELRDQALRRETSMQFPLIFLVLPVTVLFALYPSSQFLQFNG